MKATLAAHFMPMIYCSPLQESPAPSRHNTPDGHVTSAGSLSPYGNVQQQQQQQGSGLASASPSSLASSPWDVLSSPSSAQSQWTASTSPVRVMPSGASTPSPAHTATATLGPSSPRGTSTSVSGVYDTPSAFFPHHTTATVVDIDIGGSAYSSQLDGRGLYRGSTPIGQYGSGRGQSIKPIGQNQNGSGTGRSQLQQQQQQAKHFSSQDSRDSINNSFIGQGGRKISTPIGQGGRDLNQSAVVPRQSSMIDSSDLTMPMSRSKDPYQRPLRSALGKMWSRARPSRWSTSAPVLGDTWVTSMVCGDIIGAWALNV